MRHIALFGFTLAVATLTSASADTLIQLNTPTGTVAPNAGSSYAGLVNGLGLSNALPTGTDTALALSTTQANSVIANCYVTHSPGGDYYSGANPLPILTFTLGGTFGDINSIIFWNYNQGTGVAGSAQNNSVKTFTLEFYSDAAATALIDTVPNLTVARAFPETGAGSAAQIAQQIFFPGGVDFDGVQSIRMLLTDNYFGEAGGAGGDRAGFSEIRLSQVPEPTGVLLGGVGLAGLLLRRRRA